MRTATAVLEQFRHTLAVDRSTAVITAVIGLAAVWWTAVYTGSVPMPGMLALMNNDIPMAAPGAMERGVAAVGTPGAVLGYIAMWGVMMWAMMYPAMTRFACEYIDALRGSPYRVLGTVVTFFIGYSVVWALTGIVPLGIDAILPGGIYGFTRTHTHLAIGGALVIAGIYQLSPLKLGWLRSCCACVTVHEADLIAGLKRGVNHGLSCVAVCFGFFFLVMPVFGEMNFFWMMALTLVATAERLPARGREVAVASGLLALVGGLIVLVFEPTLPVKFVMAMQ